MSNQPPIDGMSQILLKFCYREPSSRTEKLETFKYRGRPYDLKISEIFQSQDSGLGGLECLFSDSGFFIKKKFSKIRNTPWYEMTQRLAQYLTRRRREKHQFLTLGRIFNQLLIISIIYAWGIGKNNGLCKSKLRQWNFD